MQTAILAASSTQQSSPYSFLFLVGILVLFYFLMIRPQKRAKEQHAQLIRSIEVGDEVETAGGIFGKVRRMDETTVGLEVSPGVTVKVSRAAIRRKVQG